MSQLSMSVSDNIKDLVSDFLLGLNAKSVTEDVKNTGHCTLKAIFTIDTDFGPIFKRINAYSDFLRENFNNCLIGEFLVENIDRSDWEIWKTFLKTVKAGERIVITPPWDSYNPGDNEIVIEINPSMAFGTGHHETTRLCIKFLEEITEKYTINSILDVGCGSAVLSIAAVKLGVTKAVALDIDEVAVREAKDNLSRNCIENIDLLCGSIECAKGKFDTIVANINVEALLNMRESFNEKLKKNGFLILSGIPEARGDELIKGMEDGGFLKLRKVIDGDWVSVLFKPA